MTSRILFAAIATFALFGNACAAEEGSAAQHATAVAGAAVTGFVAPEEAWRTVDPENLIIIDTKYGDIGIELFPEIAPKHVAQVKALARSGFYNNVPFHRVIDGFMNQTGDGANGDGTGDSDLPDIEAEFTFRRGSDLPFTLVTAQQVGQGEIGVGFYKSLPIACLLYTSPSPRDLSTSRMPSSA